MIIDWYEHVPGQPLTCIIQVNTRELLKSEQRVKLPSYLCVDRDITDLEEFKTSTFAKKDYKLVQESKE